MAAFKSLLQTGFEIEVLSDDKEILRLQRDSCKKVRTFSDFTCEVVVCAGFKTIVKKESLERYAILNVHYSLLPLYRGLHSVVWAILNGDKNFGYTVHLMDNSIDSGPIIYQASFQSENATSADIMTWCHTDVQANLGETVKGFIDGKVQCVAQNDELATWVPKRNLEDCHIDWSWPAEFLERFLRALVPPYPLPYFFLDGEIIEVIDSVVLRREYFCTPGRVVNINNTGVYVKVADGLLLIKKICFEGAEVDAQKYLKLGQRLK